MKLGKKPARKNAVLFKLSNYVDKRVLPKPPKSFGHEDLISPNAWQMLGNDQYGDCVFAGAAHETMLWNAEAGSQVNFTDKAVLSDYSTVTGFDPNDPASDQGTDMQEAASYRRKTGIVDAKGKRHKVVAYLALTPGDISDLYVAMYLFGGVGFGFRFPKSAAAQFDAGKPWRVVARSPIEGGHYVPLVAHRNSILCVTWGRVQHMSLAFYKHYNDESVVYISEERLKDGKSLEGFNLAQLKADLAQLS